MPSPVLRAMRAGALVRVEELTRIPSDVQDALITILSEKSLPIPELGEEVQAAQGLQPHRHGQRPRPGCQRAVQPRCAAGSTRCVLPLPASAEEEVAIVTRRVAALGRALELPDVPSAQDEIRRVVTVFRELRAGVTDDGRTSLKSPTATLSPAEAISVVTNGLSLAAHFGDGALRADDVADGIVGAVVKDPIHDAVAWREYLEAVIRDRPGWARPLPRLPRGDVSRSPTACSGSATTVRARPASVPGALDALPPDVVCIEGPPEAEAIAPLAADPAMAPPVALLAYDLDEPARRRLLAARQLQPGVAGAALGARP